VLRNDARFHRLNGPDVVSILPMSGDEWVAVIIEDDADVRDLIDIVLTQSGFRTVVTENGPAGVEAVRAHNPLITTLDVNMPGMDGFAVAKRLREFSDTYLIMITALADEIDVVQGFEAGADDYLVKPFRPRELRARADSMLRRPRARSEKPAGRSDGATPVSAPVPTEPLATPALAKQAVPPAPTPLAQNPAAPLPRHAAPQRPAVAPALDFSSLQYNGLALASDGETRTVTVNGEPVDLTSTEFDLLSSLLGTGRRVRSKADLVLTMRGQQYVTSYFVNEADKHSVEQQIEGLRRKLGDDGPMPRYIETVGGVGYRMAENV
jgi:two-component system OmpR family response regulator